MSDYHHIDANLPPPEMDYRRVFGPKDKEFYRRYFIEASRSRKLRPIGQWAEEEVIIPTGPFEGLKFRMDRQPCAKLLYDAFDDPHWQEYGITGSTQTGKSFLGFALPVCHCLCERKEDAIISGPTLELLQDKVKRDIYPILEASRYADIIPRRGGGSKGGIPDRIDFTNGTVLKLMSFEGGDKSKASFTCPNIFMTEVDGSRAQTTSQEANPIEQIKARARATEREKRFILYECTVSVEEGNIWQITQNIGSAARIMLKCPYCGDWSRPDREDLRGWEQARTELEAEELTAWHCPLCEHPWTEADRKRANLNAQLMHRGQHMEGDAVVGDLPPTRTLGFRFSAVNNLFLPAKDVGVDCWHVRQDEDDLDGEKKLTQFVFALPYHAPGLDMVKIDRSALEQRQLDYQKGAVPEDTQWITIGFDVGKHDCWWTAIAWLVERRIGLIMDYGRIKMKMKVRGKWLGPDDVGFETVFEDRVTDWKERVDAGWMDSEGKMNSYNALWIDARYQGDDPDVPVVYQALRRWGDKRVLPIMGHSQNHYQRSKYREPAARAKNVVRRGHHYDVRFVEEIRMHRGHIDSDAWKTIVQRSITREKGEPGSIMLYKSMNPREHAVFAKHIDAEMRDQHFEQGKGDVQKWIVKRQANHWLDSTVYACAAGHWAGFRANPDNEKRKRKITRRMGGMSSRDGRSFVASQRR